MGDGKNLFLRYIARLVIDISDINHRQAMIYTTSISRGS